MRFIKFDNQIVDVANCKFALLGGAEYKNYNTDKEEVTDLFQITLSETKPDYGNEPYILVEKFYNEELRDARFSELERLLCIDFEKELIRMCDNILEMQKVFTAFLTKGKP